MLAPMFTDAGLLRMSASISIVLPQPCKEKHLFLGMADFQHSGDQPTPVISFQSYLAVVPAWTTSRVQ